MRRATTCGLIGTFGAFSAIASTALANSGTALPLDQYQAGTEQTNATIVANGSFEAIHAGDPTGWTLGGRFGVGSPTGANTEHNGTRSAQGVLTYSELGWYERSISLQRHTDYTVSAYMWSFGTTVGDESFVQVHDSAGGVTSELVLTTFEAEPDARRGVFMHETFNSGNDDSMTIRVGTQAGPRSEPGGTVPRTLKGQLDNIAITPAAQFVPPQSIAGGGSSTWNTNGGGNWSAASNWLGGVPDGVGGIANFGSIITSAATITLDSARTVGSVNFNNTNKYTIAGTNTLTLDVITGVAAMRVTDFGSHEIATPVQLNDSTDVTVSLAGSTLRLSGQVSAAAGVTLTKRGPGLLEMRNVRAPALNVTSGTLRVLLDGTSAATSSVATLTVDQSMSRLDVTNNAFVVDYTGSSPVVEIRNDIVQGYNGGTWDGLGIMSSLGNASQFGVGYVEASQLTSVPAIFGTVDSTAVLFRLTRYGDTNLDGVVNLSDFNALASNFGQAGRIWTQGDFNYDGNVNLSDFNLLAGNFGLSAAGPEVTPQDWANLAAAVPEPSATLLAAAACTMLRRRRYD